MAALKVVTYAEAGELLGGDAPLSLRTIERMVQAGDLERAGERKRRRITERSILAYQEGARGQWRKGANDEPLALGVQPKRPMARGRRAIPSLAVVTTSDEVSIVDRLPKLGVIRSST